MEISSYVIITKVITNFSKLQKLIMDKSTSNSNRPIRHQLFWMPQKNSERRQLKNSSAINLRKNSECKKSRLTQDSISSIHFVVRCLMSANAKQKNKIQSSNIPSMEETTNYGRQRLYESTQIKQRLIYICLSPIKQTLSNSYLFYQSKNFMLAGHQHRIDQGTQFNYNDLETYHQQYPRSKTKLNQIDYPFTRKPKSYKKHYPNNLHQLSQMKILGSVCPPPKLQTKHDKLDVNDIIGARPNYYRNQIFKNRVYGKRMDRKDIFSTQHYSQHPILQNRIPPYSNISNHKNELLSFPKLGLNSEADHFAYQPFSKSTKLNIQPVMDVRYPTASKQPYIQKSRRVKTQLQNPQYYAKQQGISRQLRKWNPTNLSSNNQSFLFRLEPIK